MRGNTEASYWIEEAVRYSREVTGSFPPFEANGKYIDMCLLHQKFLNMKRLRDHLIKSFVQCRWAKYLTKNKEESSPTNFARFSELESTKYRDPDYVTWMESFYHFDAIPRHLKYRQAEYLVWNESLFSLLNRF